LSLSDTQLDRYARHLVLRDIGGAGQMRLRMAHVVLIGAGGIGCPAIQYLAAAGVGRLTVIDDDRVSLSNLQRQVLYGDADIGRLKVEAAADAVARLNPDVVFDGRVERLSAGSSLDLAGVACVIDGSDNFATRLLVNDHCVTQSVPLVSAAIGQFHGQIGTFRGHEADKPCYRCFVGDAHDPDDDCDSCVELGVLGAMVGLMGSFAAMEAIRVITGFGDDPAGQIQIIDGLKPSMRSIRLPKDPACSTCGASALQP
jgi:molybdopterin-synthase adenylyltransferase